MSCKRRRHKRYEVERRILNRHGVDPHSFYGDGRHDATLFIQNLIKRKVSELGGLIELRGGTYRINP